MAQEEDASITASCLNTEWTRPNYMHWFCFNWEICFQYSRPFWNPFLKKYLLWIGEITNHNTYGLVKNFDSGITLDRQTATNDCVAVDASCWGTNLAPRTLANTFWQFRCEPCQRTHVWNAKRCKFFFTVTYMVQITFTSSYLSCDVTRISYMIGRRVRRGTRFIKSMSNVQLNKNLN